MASIINIPFNFQPVNTGVVANGSYTVPAGKYARVMATLSVKSYMGPLVQVSGSVDGGNGEDSVSIELWLKSGDIVSVSNSAGSATATASGNINQASNFANAISTANLLVNGVVVSSVTCASWVYLTPANTTIFNLSGTANVNYQYAEFTNIS